MIFTGKMRNQTITSKNTGGDESMLPSRNDPAFTIVFVILAPTLVILLQVFTARIRNSNHSNHSNNSNHSNHSNSSNNSNKSNLISQPIHDHNRRRIQHSLTGFLFYILSFILPYSIACTILSIATTSFYILLKARSKSTYIQQQYIQHFGPLLRENECNVNTSPGAFWFLLGTTILVLSFPMDIVRTSLLCLSFGDPVASIAGMNFGGPKIHFRYGVKSFTGCCSCFVTCVIISMMCMGIQYGPGIWILTGLVATLMEVSSGFTGINDNILIPLGTGAALSLLRINMH